LAANIQDSLGVPTVELASGHRGEFSIWVGDTCVARKTVEGYPAESAVVEAVRAALS